MNSSFDLESHYARLRSEPRLPRLSPHTLRAAWWALRSVRAARRDLRKNGLDARVAAPPPSLPWGSRTGVDGVLNRVSPTCLESALVKQRWLAAHRVSCDVIVGVARDEAGAVRAHAWLEGIASPAEYAKYSIIHRIPPIRD